MSFSLYQLHSTKNSSHLVLKEIKKLIDQLDHVDQRLTSEEKLTTFFKSILILNFVTNLFIGLDFVKKVINPNLTSWFDVYEQFGDPYQLVIELNTYIPIIQNTRQVKYLDETSENNIAKKLRKISWGKSAEILSKKLNWEKNHKNSNTNPFQDITFDIFEQISYLLRNEKEQTSVFKGSVYTPYFLAKQIVEKIFLNWLRNGDEEIKANNSYKDLKILDPAVGTGVFLIAAGNVIYEKLQQKNARRSITTIKKKIIKNNLYGLDTDEIACYITRVKMILWLIREEENIIPNLKGLFPNIGKGDSLVGYLEIPETLNKDEKSKDKLIRLFHKNLKKKLAIYQLPPQTVFQKAIELINSDFISFKTQDGFKFFIVEGDLGNWNNCKENLLKSYRGKVHFSIPDKTADKVIHLYAVFIDGSPHNKFIIKKKMKLHYFEDVFNWGDSPFPSKYDIIVGNPPFIALTDLSMKTRLKLKYLFPQIYTGNNDLSFFFLERMTSLLNNNGILGFLLPKYFQTSVYARKIRSSIVEKNLILELHDFSNIPIFQNTDVKTCFLSLKKQNPTKNQEFLYYKYNKENFKVIKKLNFSQSQLKPEKWIILHPDILQLLNRIQKYSSHTLKEVAMISKGIETGCDKIFAPKTPFFFSKHLNLEPQYYRSWIKGKEINPFFIKREGREVLYAPKSRQYEIEQSLKILQYLDQNRNLLINRSRVIKYYLWREGDERNTMHWEQRKIVCPYKAKVNTFAIDFDGSLTSKDVTWIVLKKDYSSNDFIFYLTGLLNSNVMIFYAQHIFKDLGNIYDFYPRQIQELPIITPIISSNEYKKICEITKRLQNTDQIQETDMLKKNMNRIVYQLYNLNEKEINQIESNLTF